MTFMLSCEEWPSDGLRRPRPGESSTHPFNLKFSILNSQFAIPRAPPAAASPHRELARTRLFLLFLLAAASLAAALIFASAARAAARPRVSITPISYETWTGKPWAGKESNVYVRIAITNTGHIALTYNPMNFCDDAWLRTESPRGWTNQDIHPELAVPALISVLKPGARDIRLIRLPPDTQRWQVGYTVRAASPRLRVLASLPPRWYPRLCGICGRFLPDREGPRQTVQSPIFEYPQNEPLAMVSLLPTSFDSESPPWVVPEPPPHP